MLVGPLASDLALLIGLSRALFGRGDFQASLDTLDALQRDNPGYESREGYMTMPVTSRCSAEPARPRKSTAR